MHTVDRCGQQLLCRHANLPSHPH